MASSDEDDIEALRLAALATIKPKDEPQGIQVVSTVQPPAVPMQPFFEHPPTVEPFLEHKQVEDIDPDFAELQHAFLQQQQQLQHQQQLPYLNRGRGGFRGRGFVRGRGRGRGYTKFQPEMNTFPPPLQQQSALIVIQTEIPEEEGRQKKGQEKRPLLLRPQDKWGMADTSSQSSSSPKTRDNSKFSRYDDDTDSEDDFEPMATDNDVDEDIAGDDDGEDTDEDETEENDSYIDRSFSETDPEVNNETTDKISQDILENKDYMEKEIHNNGSEVIENCDKPEVLSEKTFEDTAVKLTPIETKENGTVEKVSNVVEQNENSGNDFKEATTVSNDVDICHEKTGDIQEADKTSDSEVTSTSIEHVTADVRQEDSVSNSYSSFSRFNRRRKKSDSGDESDSDMEDNSRQSNWSIEEKPKFSIASDNLSGPESDTANHESETEDTKSDKHTDVQDKSTVIEDKTNISRSRSHSRSRSLNSSASRSSSSSSSSSSASSSSSSSSASSSSSSSSSSTQSKGKADQNIEKVSLLGAKEKCDDQGTPKLLENKKDRKKQSLVSPSNKTKRTSNLKNREKDPVSDRKVNHSAKKDRRSGREKSPSPRRTSYSSSKRSRSPRHEFQQSRTPKRKTVHHSVSPIRDKEAVIEADPEFDAANYRKDGVFKKDTVKPKNAAEKNDQISKHFTDRYESLSKENKSSRQISEIRHFKQITELKSEENKKSKRKDSEGKERNDRHDIKTSRNYKLDDRLISDKYAQSIRSESKFTYNSKDRHRSNSRSVSPKIDRKQRKRSRSKTLQEKDSKSSPKYSKSADSFIRKRDNDSRISKSSTELNRQKMKRKNDRNLNLRREKDKGVEGMKGDSSSRDKRKSIEEKLKKIADLPSSSDSESSSEKSVSGLSDMSSDSESETWRNKKSGASRDVDDIIRERQRRKQLERERRRNSEREKERAKEKMDRGDGDKSSLHDTSKDKSDKLKSDRRDRIDDDVRQRQHGKRKMIFLDEKSKRKPVFEELSSDSDSERKSFRSVSSIVAGGRVSNIVSGSSFKSNIPSLLDINVSQPRVSKLGNSAKNERLVIQVGQPSDDERGKLRTKHKHNKLRKGERKKNSEDRSDDENSNWSRKHIVSVTYNQDSEGSDSENPRKSVYERLGIQISSSSKPSTNSQRSQDSKSKRYRDRSPSPSGKRVKLNDQRKHSSRRKHHNAGKQEKGQDEALNKRIKQIQEKNAEILRRKMEVEQDKQKYG